jgi:hypothetical protein
LYFKNSSKSGCKSAQSVQRMQKNNSKMKIVKILIGLILLYSIFFRLITGFFDFLNKNRDMGFWISIFESDLPNLVGIFSMIYLLWFLIKSKEQSN